MPIKFRNSPVREPFAFDSVGNRWQQESVLRPKGFPHYHYLLTEKGCGRIEIDGKKYLLKEGEGVLIAPFIRHAYTRESALWTTAFATFTGTLESSISKMLDGRLTVFTSPEQKSAIIALLDSVMEKYDRPPVDDQTLSIDCYRLLMYFVDGVYSGRMSADPLYQRYVAPVIQEIETNYDTALTVRALSSRVFVTPQYLSRLFVRFLGCTVYEYLTAYRINTARELLIVNPRREIQEIGQRTGFDDASHFIAMFKKKTGMTPGEFQKEFSGRQ